MSPDTFYRRTISSKAASGHEKNPALTSRCRFFLKVSSHMRRYPRNRFHMRKYFRKWSGLKYGNTEGNKSRDTVLLNSVYCRPLKYREMIPFWITRWQKIAIYRTQQCNKNCIFLRYYCAYTMMLWLTDWLAKSASIEIPGAAGNSSVNQAQLTKSRIEIVYISIPTTTLREF